MINLANSTRTKQASVAIIGRGKTRKYFQYRAGLHVWAFNDNAMTIPPEQLSGVFEVHPDWDTRYNGIIGCEGYVEWLQQGHAFPIYMLVRDNRIPNSIRYPYPIQAGELFTSTTPYAIALAIHLGYRTIELYGIEADPGVEYAGSRDAIYYWLGRAIGAGLEIKVHEECELLKAPLYPFGYDKTPEEQIEIAQKNIASWTRYKESAERKINR